MRVFLWSRRSGSISLQPSDNGLNLVNGRIDLAFTLGAGDVSLMSHFCRYVFTFHTSSNVYVCPAVCREDTEKPEHQAALTCSMFLLIFLF